MAQLDQYQPLHSQQQSSSNITVSFEETNPLLYEMRTALKPLKFLNIVDIIYNWILYPIP